MSMPPVGCEDTVGEAVGVTAGEAVGVAAGEAVGLLDDDGPTTSADINVMLGALALVLAHPASDTIEAIMANITKNARIFLGRSFIIFIHKTS